MAVEKREVLVKITLDNKEAIDSQAKMTEATQKGTAAQDENTEAVEDGEKATEDYSAATGALTGQIDKMTGGLASTTKGIFSTIKGFKSLKVAIAASGIGLIVLAFAALGTAVSRLDGPMRIFEDIMGGISVVTGELLDRFGRIGEAIIQLFQGNFKAAGEIAKSAVTGLADSLDTAWTAGTNLAKAERELEIQTAKTNSEMAIRRDRIQQLRTEAREETKDFQKAAKIIAEAGRLERINLNARIALEEQAQKVIQARFETSSQSYKDEIELTNALTESQTKINAARAQEREFVLAQNEFNTRAAAQAKKQQDEELARIKAINDEKKAFAAFLKEQSKLDIDEEVTVFLEAEDVKLQAELDSIAKIRDEEVKAAAEKKAEDEAKIIREGIAKQAAIAGAVEVATLVAALGADGAKAQAIFQGAAAIANAWQAFIVTLADPLVPFWGKFAAGAAVLTAGLNAAVKVKTAYAAGMPEMALGGWLQGTKTHAQGGIDVNGEVGEFMVNKRSMANPFLASIVQNINDSGNRQVMALGGFVGSQASQLSAIRALPGDLGNIVNQTQTVLVTEDLDVVQGRVAVTEDRSTLSG